MREDMEFRDIEFRPKNSESLKKVGDSSEREKYKFTFTGSLGKVYLTLRSQKEKGVRRTKWVGTCDGD